MASSIKIRDADRRRLDRLQGEIMARRGRRISQQELMAMLLDLGEALRGRLLEEAQQPMTKREIAALDRLVVSTGIRTRQEEIDEAVAREAR